MACFMLFRMIIIGYCYISHETLIVTL